MRSHRITRPGSSLPLFAERPRADRAPKVPPPLEVTGLHIPIAAHLARFVAPGWEFTHPANGEHRDKRTAAKLRAMGVRPGWPDLVLISPDGRFHGLEFKRKGGRLSEPQQAFHEHAKRHGWPIATADSIDGAIAVLSRWGALRYTLGGRS